MLSGSTGDSLEVWRELDLERVEKDLRGVLSRGITSLAVLLLHSYTSVVQLVFVPFRHRGVFTQDPNLISCPLFLSLAFSPSLKQILHVFFFATVYSIMQFLLRVSMGVEVCTLHMSELSGVQ